MRKTLIAILLIIFLPPSANVQDHVQWQAAQPQSLPDAISNTGSSDTFKILTYNIHAGRGTDDEYNFKRIADVIIASGADIVALQEVDSGVERSGSVDIMQILADQTGMEPLFYRNIDLQGGEYGNGILTRFPVIDAGNTHLPRVGDSEQRGLMHAMLNVGGVEIAVLNTHLDHRPISEERLKGVEAIMQVRRRFSGMPVILAGDLNAEPGHEVHHRMKDRFTDLWEVSGEGNGFTYHTSAPDRRIDYIFFSNDDTGDPGYRIRPVSAEVLESDGSDHLPLLGVFVIERSN